MTPTVRTAGSFAIRPEARTPRTPRGLSLATPSAVVQWHPAGGEGRGSFREGRPSRTPRTRWGAYS
jgi:hypothetical protein